LYVNDLRGELTAICKLLLGLATAFAALSSTARAEDSMFAFEAHGQATYVRQFKPGFDAAYSGPKSLIAEREYGYTFTGTLFLGVTLGENVEIYYNPEATQASPLSGLQGLGGFTNGENQRGAGSQIKVYRARAFVRGTWNIGGEFEAKESEANQVRTRYAAERVVVTFGNVAAVDIFDAVEYSRDPRGQFMNWASLTYGAWDYPADARGYTWGLAGEYISPSWSMRAGRFLMPEESNGVKLDRNWTQIYGDAVELEKPFQISGRKGVARLLAFHNQVNAGSFEDAIAVGEQTGTTPDVALVRRPQSKKGLGAGVQYEMTPDVGAYLRAGWNDGRTETFAFTEIDRSLAGGVLVKGSSWKRSEDSIGLAGYLNGLSQAHRDYLAAGGQGFFLGDGQLTYGREKIAELFYSLSVVRGAWLTADFQYVTNPGYNRDRGPAQIYNLRVHVEF
jgi:high affinity Mn2+ porin